MSIKHRFLTVQLIIGLVIIFAVVLSMQAQSGRQTSPKATYPTPTPSPEPTSRPTMQSKPLAKPEYSFKVVSDIPQTLYMQFTFPENIQKWVVERLKTSSLLAAESGSLTSRKDAIKMAKESADTYVVMLELEENHFVTNPSGKGTRAEQGEIWINFYVLTPGTGKAVLLGKSALESKTNILTPGRANKIRACYPNVYGDDSLLLNASLQVGERIMEKFNVPVPPIC